MPDESINYKQGNAITELSMLISSGRIRESSLDAILAWCEGSGTLVCVKPPNSGRPIEASLVTGGVAFVVQEIRALNP